MTDTPTATVAAQDKLPVFISWSLPLSEQIASILRQWLVDVVPSIAPWFSGNDIETGKFWQLELFKSLERSTVGIVVVTPANANRPWLNFEAGRLSSKIESKGGVVMPLLVNLELADITDSPLSTLNAVTFNEAGVWKIVKAIHERTGNDATEAMLRGLFDLHWDKLSENVVAAIDEAVAKDAGDARPEKREISDVLEDLVVTVGELRQNMQRRSLGSFGSWPPINEFAVYEEVQRTLQRIGITPTGIAIVDVHSNGQIFLSVLIDGPVTDSIRARVSNTLGRASKYVAEVVEVVGSDAPVPVVPESDENQA